jgi:NADH dehydrogenase
MANNRILILGGGFAGLYTALELERLLAKDRDTEITLVNRDNFFLFTPMLHEVAASDLDLTNIVNPVRKLLRKTQFFQGEVQAVDLERRRVTVAHGFDHHPHDLEYDRLVLGLGSTTNFFNLPGLQENALTMKSLADAINLRNRLIALLEEADTECCSALRRPLLTLVVAGGGFAGVETIAGLNDFLHEAIRYYPNLRPDQVRVVLVHPGAVILPELNASLGRYAQKKLEERGVEIRLNCKVTAYDGTVATLTDGESVVCKTLIWTAGTTPSMLLNDLPCEKQRGRVVVDDTLEIPSRRGVWALGDCALISDRKRGGYYPPTAQHALRQGRVAARNILASLRGGEKTAFSFATIGQLAAIGRRTGVANILGVNFSGFIAWWLWRTIYLSKLPRFEKKLRVALDWTLDVLFSKDLVQFVNFRDAVAMSPVLAQPAREEVMKEAAS